MPKQKFNWSRQKKLDRMYRYGTTSKYKNDDILIKGMQGQTYSGRHEIKKIPFSGIIKNLNILFDAYQPHNTKEKVILTTEQNALVYCAIRFVYSNLRPSRVEKAKDCDLVALQALAANLQINLEKYKFEQPSNRIHMEVYVAIAIRKVLYQKFKQNKKHETVIEPKNIKKLKNEVVELALLLSGFVGNIKRAPNGQWDNDLKKYEKKLNILLLEWARLSKRDKSNKWGSIQNCCNHLKEAQMLIRQYKEASLLKLQSGVLQENIDETRLLGIKIGEYSTSFDHFSANEIIAQFQEYNFITELNKFRGLVYELYKAKRVYDNTDLTNEYNLLVQQYFKMKLHVLNKIVMAFEEEFVLVITTPKSVNGPTQLQKYKEIKRRPEIYISKKELSIPECLITPHLDNCTDSDQIKHSKYIASVELLLARARAIRIKVDGGYTYNDEFSTQHRTNLLQKNKTS